jgi:hypothetical protein
LCVAREKDAQIGRYSGGATLYRFDAESSFTGTPSAESIVIVGNTAYYFGSDLRFHAWSGVQDEEVQGDEYYPYTKNINPDGKRMVSGIFINHKKQVRWLFPYGDGVAYPTAALVYSLQYQTINVWEYAVDQALGSVGVYSQSADIFADDPVWGELYADETEGYADERTFSAGSDTIIYGGYDGKVRLADIGVTDVGTSFTRLFRTGDRNFGLPTQNKRLFREQYWFNSQVSGSVSMKYRLNQKNDFDATTKTVDFSSASKRVVKKLVKWNKRALTHQLEISGTAHFELIGLISFVTARRKGY